MFQILTLGYYLRSFTIKSNNNIIIKNSIILKISKKHDVQGTSRVAASHHHHLNHHLNHHHRSGNKHRQHSQGHNKKRHTFSLSANAALSFSSLNTAYGKSNLASSGTCTDKTTGVVVATAATVAPQPAGPTSCTLTVNDQLVPRDIIIK